MTSEWCCVLFTVPRPSPADPNTIDGWRMVVNFRNLSAGTKAHSHPPPLIEEEIAKRARDRLFSVLHLRHEFRPIPLRKDSRPLTCMYTPFCPVLVNDHAHGTEECALILSENDGGRAF